MGQRSGAEWLARTMGTSRGQASTAIETAKAIDGLTAAKESLAAGRLSEAQVAEVAKAPAVDPSAEHALLQTAEHGDLRALKYQARRVCLKAEAPEDLHERPHQAREFHHWVDDEGMIAGRFRLPPEVGIPLVNRIDAHADRHYKQAWRQGHPGTRAAHAADALVELLSGGGSRGPIHKVRHFGRHIPAEVRTALELGPPPNLDGASCVEEGCGRRHGLEWDHLDPLAHHGPTAYHNLKAR